MRVLKCSSSQLKEVVTMETRHEDMTPERLEEMKRDFRLKTTQAKYPTLVIPTTNEVNKFKPLKKLEPLHTSYVNVASLMVPFI